MPWLSYKKDTISASFLFQGIQRRQELILEQFSKGEKSLRCGMKFLIRKLEHRISWITLDMKKQLNQPIVSNISSLIEMNMLLLDH